MNSDLVSEIGIALVDSGHYETAQKFQNWLTKDGQEVTEYRNLFARLQGVVDMGSSNAIKIILEKFKPRV